MGRNRDVVSLPAEMTAPLIVELTDPRAEDPELVGAKAASLARARRAGLPVMPGWVVTVEGVRAINDQGGCRAVSDVLKARYDQQDDIPLVVRSSSTVEDRENSSMAGQFTSVLDVRGWEDFGAAVCKVIASARTVEAANAPIAVLVQPLLEPIAGGVMFGIDPVTGRRDRRVVAAVTGGPDKLVSGEVDGAYYVLSPRGRVVEAADPIAEIGKKELRALARLSKKVDRVFGAPQDVEWAIDGELGLVLLQSRPVTAAATTADGPIWGRAPVAETFPEPLSRLEADLWVPPLADGVRAALRLAGITVPHARHRELVTTIGGWVVIDLDAVGAARKRRAVIAYLDPRPGARRLRAAWRVGRLRNLLPVLAAEAVADADERLDEVPPVDELTDGQLFGILRTSKHVLSALHAQEVLCGLLADTRSTNAGGATGAAMALWALAHGRADGLSDDAIVRRWPAVLALVPPHVGPARPLPPMDGSRPMLPKPFADDMLAAREQLRMRVRWVQELEARTAWALATRLARAGILRAAEQVRAYTLEELDAAWRAGAAGDPEPVVEIPMPPEQFRLAEDGSIVPLVDGGTSTARGVSAGRHRGVVRDPEHPDSGDILVVRTLDPTLAPQLPGLGALVAETGSVLSHLAILAREQGVPTVVGAAGAVERFPPGTEIVVDGSTGVVESAELTGQEVMA
jgi:pyruvate,water dikinase